MTEQEIKDKAKDVYIRCFDDDINYPCVLEALEIAIRESTEDQIADIKANCDLAIEGRDLKIKELELELTVEKDQHQEEINLHLHAEDYIKELERLNSNQAESLRVTMLEEEKKGKRIEELEQQIEKMKCGQNCKHLYINLCDLNFLTCSNCKDKWEIKENEL